jgi:hypothetical protein
LLRYANQDDEDLELAMQALGHIKVKETPVEREKTIENSNKELLKRQEKVSYYYHFN